jgi:PAS domain S-box-containing protein
MRNERKGSFDDLRPGQVDSETIRPGRELQELTVHRTGAEGTIDKLGESEVGDEQQDQKVSEEASQNRLLGELEVFRSLIEKVSDIFTIASADGRFEYLSRSIKLGYEPGDLLGREVSEFLHPDDWPRVAASMAQALAAPRQILSVEHRFRHKDGKWLCMESQGFADIGPDGNLRLIATTRDISERKKAEAALRESEKRFRRVVEHIDDGLIVEDILGKVTYANDRFLDLFAFDRIEIPSITLEGCVACEYRVELRELRNRRIRGEAASRQFECQGVRRDGERIWIEVDVVPITDETGTITGTQSAIRDITKRRKAEDALRAKEQEYAAELGRRVEQRTEELRRANEEIRKRSAALESLAWELTDTEHRERLRLAEVLHDGLQQLLVGAQLSLKIVSAQASKHQKPELQRLRAVLDEAIQASRSLTCDLCPPALSDGGLASAFSWLAGQMKEKHGLSVQLIIEDQAEPSNDSVKILLFNAVRELLFNVVKHAETCEARLEVSTREESLVIRVTDAGAGFDPTGLATDGGFGLFSIRERLGLFRGTLKIESGPGKGARFTITAPLKR